MNLKSLAKSPRTLFFIGTGIGSLFVVHVFNLYHQLTTSFTQNEQFLPTQIYSDVTQIAPPLPRSDIEKRLKSLGYATTSSDSTLEFRLHSVDYPKSLIPAAHPLLTAPSREVVLHFMNPGKASALQSITLGGQEVPDIFLEPELVATFSRNGETRKEIRASLKFDEIPASLWKAIIAIEDQHFLEHNGFDPRGIARAFWVNIRTLSLAQGGSTITQQLVKNLMARRTKNVFRKANELLLSLLLEINYEKENILERYLNEVYLGQIGNLEIHGVAQGSEHFFGKKIENLNLAEAALMAGLIRGPAYYSPYRYRERALERQRLVLRKMVETGQIAEAEAQAALKTPIRLAHPKSSTNRAPFFSDYVKAELLRILKGRLSENEIMQSGFQVYTTLDTLLNQYGQTAITEGVTRLEKYYKLSGESRLEGILVSVDPRTGYIRSLIGGKDYSTSNFNRILNMKRQVGSTFKPIVYLTAFNQGMDTKGVPYSPAHPILDAPWTLKFDEGRQSWTPKNYEKGHQGWISYRTALSHSVNTATAKLGEEVGIPKIIKIARALGITSELPSVPSLALGVAELTPIELIQAYSTLANQGVRNELTVIRKITQSTHQGWEELSYGQSHPTKAVDPATADLLTDVLQNVFTAGTAKHAVKLGFDRPAAGKTGTTSNYRDAWFAGYTPQLTTVVWVGLDQFKTNSQTTPKLTGANSALPIWSHFMLKALANERPLPFPQSPFLIELQSDRYTGQEALTDCPSNQTILEKFIRGQEPRQKTCQAHWPE